MQLFHEAFLRVRSFAEPICGVIDSSRNAAQRFPLGGGLSPILFNLAIACANDVTLWYVGKASKAKVIRTQLQELLSAVSVGARVLHFTS